MEWQPIQSCPLGRRALFWNHVWRNPYPGTKNGDYGVWIDTCEAEAKGRQEVATHWCLITLPDASSAPTKGE